MREIPDAPWIRETERTGYCRSGWWNSPPDEDDEIDAGDFYDVDEEEDEDGEL